MKCRTFTTRSETVVLLLIVLGTLVSHAVGQANVQGQWNTLPYTMPINPVHVTLLNNGKVLIVSGSGNVAGNTNYRAAVWDPQAGSITTQSVAWDMFCNGMVSLPDGRVFINGGTLQYDPFHGALSTSLYDPTTKTFTDVQQMAHGRWYPTVTTLGDGRILTFSGVDENGSTNSTVEIYTVGSGWSSPFTAGWTPPLYPRLHLLPNGNVFYSGSSTQSRIFNPNTHTWTNVATTTQGSSRTYGTSVLLGLTPANNYAPRVLIMGGGNPSTATTELIDLSASTPVWVRGPDMSQPRIEMSGVILPNGKVLALGGSYNDEDVLTASLSADLYDPASTPPSFSFAGTNAYPRLYHSVALLMPDATVWVAGGNPQRGSYEQRMEVYQPAYLFTTDVNGNAVPANRPTIAGAPPTVNYGGAFALQTPDVANISSVVLMHAGSATHAFDMDQRLVELSFTLTDATTLSVTGPPNGNVAPPGFYMLFLLNNAGVPSVARFVQVAAQSDFSLSATPSSRSVVQGGNTTYTVNVAAVGGFSGNVGLTVSGLPQGGVASFNPTSVTGTGSSTLSVGTLSSPPAGNYTLTITGTSGALVHSATVTLAVNAAVGDFSIAASPASQTVSRKTSTKFTITVSAINGFSGTVNLSLSWLPKATTYTFTPSSVVGAGNSNLTISPKPPAVPGTYSVSITGTSGSVSHSTGVSLRIQ